MELKQFIEKMFEKNPMNALNTARDLIELEAIEQRLNLMWGVELDIKVVQTEQKEGRFYGKGSIETLNRYNLK
jgi:hypothetical protein